MSKLAEKLRENWLLLGTFAGIAVGVISGLLLKSAGVSNDFITVLNYPGELFIRVFQLLILPAIAFSLISGCASLNIQENGKIAVRTFMCFFSTSFLNAVIGVALVILISPGAIPQSDVLSQNLTAIERNVDNYHQIPRPGLLDNFLDLGRNMVPDNIVTVTFQQVKTVYDTKETEAGVQIIRRLEIVNGVNFIGVVFVCLAVGFILSMLGDEVKSLLDLVKAIDRLAAKSMDIMITLTPVAVAFIICGKVSEVNDLTETLAVLGWLTLTVTIGILIDQFIIQQLLYFIYIKKNPLTFYLHILPAIVMAFVTRMSAVTLPVTLRCLDEKAKADPKISHFVVPLGVTVNKNGTAMYIAVASVYLSQLSGFQLGLANYITICFTATAISFCSGGPSGSLFILQTLGVPAADIALLFSIDWLLDRLRTMNNVLGDCYTVVIVEQLSRKRGNELPK